MKGIWRIHNQSTGRCQYLVPFVETNFSNLVTVFVPVSLKVMADWAGAWISRLWSFFFPDSCRVQFYRTFSLSSKMNITLLKTFWTLIIFILPDGYIFRFIKDIKLWRTDLKTTIEGNIKTYCYMKIVSNRARTEQNYC